MNFFAKVFTILGPRILGAAAGAAAAKLAQYSITVDPATLTGIALGAYALVHKVISSKVNPGDAASSRMVSAEKTASDMGATVRVAPKS